MKDKFGVRPDQVVDVLALMGDTIDNVKGVPGIGEKGARDLISTYGTLDALLEQAPNVPQKKYREALLAHADEARSSRELLRIRTNVPVAVRHQRVQISRARPSRPATSCSPNSGSGRWSWSTRRRRKPRTPTIGSSTTESELEELARELERRGNSR